MTPLERFVYEYQKNDPIYLSNNGNDRLWVHDMLHSVLDLPSKSIRGEESMSIYHAVLLHEPNFSVRGGTHLRESADVTLERVKSEIVPAARQFINNFRIKAGREPKPGVLTEKELEDLFAHAQAVDGVVTRYYGQHLNRTPMYDIRNTSPASWEEIVSTANRIYQLTQPSPNAPNIERR